MTADAAPRIAVVGSINVDYTAQVERLPAAGETVGGGTLVRIAGGKGANQAAAAARLGGAVRMIGAVGDDADGPWSRQQLEAAGVDVSGVRTVGAPTGVALIGVDAHGENQIIVCPGANWHIDLAEAALAPDEAVITVLELPLETVVALAETHPGFLAVNASPAQPLPPELLERTDLFIVNESEYAQMPQLQQAGRVAVTYGADGAALFTDGVATARAGGRKADAVNTVGAGDAFCAALVLALRSGFDNPQALEAACAVGAAAVEHEASQPPLQRLDAYLEKEQP
ncbi:MAG TPA: PfkB family carbohydrate kinase [Microbacterium sp.]|nr:PfkB family carbohydrate kinase [Microbacterium sp.]